MKFTVYTEEVDIMVEVKQVTDNAPESQKKPFMPPRWFVYSAWKFHRAYFRVTGGRRGLWPPSRTLASGARCG